MQYHYISACPATALQREQATMNCIQCSHSTLFDFHHCPKCGWKPSSQDRSLSPSDQRPTSSLASAPEAAQPTDNAARTRESSAHLSAKQRRDLERSLVPMTDNSVPWVVVGVVLLVLEMALLMSLGRPAGFLWILGIWAIIKGTRSRVD